MDHPALMRKNPLPDGIICHPLMRLTMPIPKNVVVATREWDKMNEGDRVYQLVRQVVVNIMTRDSSAYSAEDILREMGGINDMSSVHGVFHHSSSRLAKFLDSIVGCVGVKNAFGKDSVIRSINLDGKDGQTTRYYYLDEESDVDAARKQP